MFGHMAESATASTSNSGSKITVHVLGKAKIPVNNMLCTAFMAMPKSSKINKIFKSNERDREFPLCRQDSIPGLFELQFADM